MNTAEEQFLHAIAADPENDGLRLVYADWLAKQGGESQEARAELIRGQCRIATMPPARPWLPRSLLRERVVALVTQFARQWFGPPVGSVQVSLSQANPSLGGWADWQTIAVPYPTTRIPGEILAQRPLFLLERGCLAEPLGRTTSQILREGEHWFRKIPTLHRLSLSHSSGQELVQLQDWPALARIRSLTMRGKSVGHAAAFRNAFCGLVNHPALAGLHRLALSGPSFSSTQLEDLATGSSLAGLKELTFSQLGAKGKGINLLALLAEFPSLEALHIRGTSLGRRGIRGLHKWQVKRPLVRLELTKTSRGGRSLDRLLDSPLFQGLRELYLRENQYGDEEASQISQATELGDLQILDLANQRITSTGVRALARSRHLSKLQVLCLDGNRISDVGGKALAHSPFLENLRRLELRRTGLSGGDAEGSLRSRFGEALVL